MSCHDDLKSKDKSANGKNGKQLTFALAGNANVGKSVIFNQLTGSNQIIGNWPGKTVDRAEGTLSFEGYEIKVIDLPGIYSFSTFSMEELVSRDYIALEKPDAVINVVDASVLERNLFFTLQLLEMNAPLVLVLNQVDVAKSKGMIIDKDKLQDTLAFQLSLQQQPAVKASMKQSKKQLKSPHTNLNQSTSNTEKSLKKKSSNYNA